MEHTVLTVLGDFNAKHRRWDPRSPANTAGTKLCNLFQTFALTQLVHEPTRYSADGSSSSVLDLFATSRPDLVSDTLISDPISDSLLRHRPCPTSNTSFAEIYHHHPGCQTH